MAPRLTAQQVYLRSISERAWQTTVEQLLTAAGWQYFHAPDNMPRVGRGGSTYVQNVRGGWPDIVAYRGDRRIALELKRELGAVDPRQIAWLRTLRHHGYEVGIYRPSHRDLLEALILRGQVLALDPETLYPSR